MCLYVLLASQAWTLATILPMVIGHRIPEDDLHWDCYLLLLQIIQLSTAKVMEYLLTTLHISSSNHVEHVQTYFDKDTFCIQTYTELRKLAV